MTRIVAGSVGGRVLQVPRSGTRPTSERVREALFSRLEHLGVVADARVLDLFAGSGALGLEAVSRGARDVTLVEAARAAADVCRRNATALGLADRVVVVADRAERFVDRPGGRPDEPGQPGRAWDLVLVDPPYDLAEDALGAVLAGLVPALAPDAVVVVERSTRAAEPVWPEGLARFDHRSYGETAVWFAEPTAEPAAEDVP
ncbi:16S rRNA (guanine(966)-N(2))-methyltransferase RsmD [Cellulomonas sp. DKR-3]|uniref:16S rRNA (Guanine(966)-N(2))-methyltransferase RsmD n=1 Tax=Cellulomonas fulva TaxID=2835530 RepID=A0ABS5TZX5_9CELL|nr:16S rRNA (guanine(966)-N(2))-methyltransferase RsmD [Cellulomonas fulva]MBT0994670.1 16S rRNA (guanine(966)-N(2))-methyltransferase RsmD [Cellulomonas fulva]